MTQKLFLLSIIVITTLSCSRQQPDNIVIYPAPAGEPLNETYRLTVEGQPVPVYNAKIGSGQRIMRERGMDDLAATHLFYDIAGFASFDLKSGVAHLKVSIDRPIEKARILPSSFGIEPEIDGNSLSFKIDRPQHLTVEINGEHIRSLHIFVNPEETDRPAPDDLGVIYFGPGVHKITEPIVVGDNETLYVAGGAILRCASDSLSKQSLQPSITLAGRHSRAIGRGIIDQENVPRLKARCIFVVSGEDVEMSGLVLRNPSVWTVNLQKANRVNIDNLKLLGHRANADGIDICDSWDVVVENCFIRTLDDLIVVKTYNRPEGSGNIIARRNVLWNEVAHALSIGAEIKEQVDGVVFTDCDIIGDHCREWTMRIYQCDKGVVRNVFFDNIRVEETFKLASLWINEAVWTTDRERGHIENVVFRNIEVNSPVAPMRGIEFLGFDSNHAVRNVQVENVVINGRKIAAKDVVKNEFVYGVEVK
jgi:hypothetical protein